MVPGTGRAYPLAPCSAPSRLNGALHGGTGPRVRGPRSERLLSSSLLQRRTVQGKARRGSLRQTRNLTIVNRVKGTILERMTNDRKRVT